MTLSARGLQKEDGNYQIPLAISIRPPWSQFILWGLKDVENRTWQSRYMGFLFLHISKTFDDTWRSNLDSVALAIADKKLRLARIHGKGSINWNCGTICGCFICHGSDSYRNSPWCSNQPNIRFMRITDAIKFHRPLPCPGKLKLFRPMIKIADFSEQDLALYHSLWDKSKRLGFNAEPL